MASLPCRALVCCLVVACLAVSPVSSIILHPEIQASEYNLAVTTTPFFVSLDQRGSCGGALVKASTDASTTTAYVATAAHCFCDNGERKTTATTVVFSDDSTASVQSSKVHFNPQCTFDCGEDGPNKCDVAMMEIPLSDVPDAAAAAALEVYRWDDENGKTIDIYGYGTTGNAETLNTVELCSNAEPDGQYRHGQNVITNAATGVLQYTMDCADPPPLPLEGLSGAGDSGGPAVITRENVRYLAGVNSGNQEEVECDCGTTDQYCRLFEQSSFITAVFEGNLEDLSESSAPASTTGAGVIIAMATALAVTMI